MFERAKAIGVWSAVTGIAVAAGPVSGGWLLEHFWWGSIFFVNVPVVIVAMVATVLIVPESKEAGAPRLDIGGIVARAIQHEIDHLDGILFLDHLSPMKRQLLTSRWKKDNKGKPLTRTPKPEESKAPE